MKTRVFFTKHVLVGEAPLFPAEFYKETLSRKPE